MTSDPDTRAYGQARRLASTAVAALLSSVAINATGETTVGPLLGTLAIVLGLYAAHKLGRASSTTPSRPSRPTGLRGVAG